MSGIAFRWPLEGARVLIRCFVADDLKPTYVAWLNDPEVVRFSNQRFRLHTAESSRQYLSTFKGSGNLFLAIVEREAGHMIGTMTVYRNAHHKTADLGIMVGARHTWGKGFGLESFSLVVNWLLTQPDIRKVTAGAVACNVGMVKIMERAGLRWEATRRQHELIEGRAEDLVYYARFKDA